MKSEFMNSTEESTSYKINTFLNLVLKIGSLGFNLLSIPLLISYLGEERFGIWQTLLSLGMIITVFNFGFDNGLRNEISFLLAKNERHNISRVVFGTFRFLSLATFIIAIPVIISVYYIGSNRFIEGLAVSNNEIMYSLLIFVVFSFLNNIFILTDSISLGFQRSFFTSLVQFILVFVFYIAIFGVKNNALDASLVYAVLIYSIIRVVTYVIYFISIKIKFNLEILKDLSLGGVKNMSYNFFILQLLSLAYLYIDNFAITYSLGPVKTAEYSIVYKIFFSIINIFSILLIQFWDSSRMAYVREDYKWIKKMVIRLLLLNVLVLGGCLIISVFSNEFMEIFLGDSKLQFERKTFYLFSIYTFIHCFFSVFINLFNGINLFSYQKLALIIMLIIYVLALIFGNLSTYGYDFILITKILSTVVVLPILIIPYIKNFYLRKNHKLGV